MFSRLERHVGMPSESHKRKNLYNCNWIVQLIDISAQ